MMNILFFCGCYSETEKDSYFKNCKRGYQSAAQVHQEAILRGFLQNDINVRVLSVPFLPSYPFNYKSPIVRACDFILDSKSIGKSVGMINIPYLKYKKGKILSEIRKWYVETAGDKVLVLYSLNYFWFKIALMAKKMLSNLHVCVIVPDLPVFCETGRASKVIGKENSQLSFISENIHNFDSFVLLSNPMAKALNIEDKPYIVIEGVYNKKTSSVTPAKRERNYLLYTGKLSEEFGLKDLVDAFIKTKNKNVDLVLCGEGNVVPYIHECAQKDNRIKYLGIVSNDKCVALQQGAYLLVNPRHSYEKFTEYSFPSKTMEYMASGTPTLMCELKCLPDDYRSHLLFFDHEDVECMAKKIDEVLNMDSSVLLKLGDEASQFILNQKNPKVQICIFYQFLQKQLKKE